MLKVRQHYTITVYVAIIEKEDVITIIHCTIFLEAMLYHIEFILFSAKENKKIENRIQLTTISLHWVNLHVSKMVTPWFYSC